VKAIEQMFVSQASFLYVAVQARTPPPALRATSPSSGEDKKAGALGPARHLPGERGGYKKEPGLLRPGPDHYFFFAAFLTFFTAFFTAFLTFFLAAIFLTSFY
jgi:hypothetical protein